MPGKPEQSGAAPAHLLYDKTTGRVVGRFRRYDAVKREYVACDDAEVQKIFEGEPLTSKLTDSDPRNLGVLPVTGLLPAGPVRVREDGGRARVESRPRLRVRAERDVLKGNGEDSVRLEVEALDDKDRTVRDFKGEVHLSTSRGKLSVRGGRLKLDNGRGELQLTSVNETVDTVLVRVVSSDGSASGGSLTLQFE